MAASRLIVLTGLALAGALCAGTAASVYTAAVPRGEMHALAAVGRARAYQVAETWNEGAEPTAHTLRQKAANGQLEPGQRLHIPTTVAVGACLHPREMLFGSQPERRATLDTLRAALHDLPQASAAVGAAHVLLDAFDEAAPSLDASPMGALPHRELPAMLRPLVPDRLARRVALCRTLLAN
ncbi:hypothetical protein [Gemmatimonas sp.]